MNCPMCNGTNIYKKLHIVKRDLYTTSRRFYICSDCKCVWQTEDLVAYHSYPILKRRKENDKG